MNKEERNTPIMASAGPQPATNTSHLFHPSLSRPEDKKQALLQFKSSLIKTTSSPSSLESRLIGLESWNSSSDQVYGFFIVVGILYHIGYFVLASRGSNF